MARINSTIKISNNTKGLANKIRKNLGDGMLDVVLDLKRVASASAPHDTGFLEKNAQHEVITTSDGMQGTVGFSAINKGFDYAEWTHDQKYKLGKKSAQKKGGKSKYGSGIVPVGTGYLENALENNRDGYLSHLQDKYNEALK